MDESERVRALLERIERRRREAGGAAGASPGLLGELRALVAEAEAHAREKTPGEVEGMR
jgi:hypothetical protein